MEWQISKIKWNEKVFVYKIKLKKSVDLITIILLDYFILCHSVCSIRFGITQRCILCLYASFTFLLQLYSILSSRMLPTGVLFFPFKFSRLLWCFVQYKFPLLTFVPFPSDGLLWALYQPCIRLLLFPWLRQSVWIQSWTFLEKWNLLVLFHDDTVIISTSSEMPSLNKLIYDGTNETSNCEKEN